MCCGSGTKVIPTLRSPGTEESRSKRLPEDLTVSGENCADDPIATTFKRTVVGRYSQFPVKLAWAVTIHKSQGQTFSRVNLNPSCWDSGQLYVALSRVRSVDGLHFTRPIYDKYLFLDPKIASFYRKLEDNVPSDSGIARDMEYERAESQKAVVHEATQFVQSSLF